VGVRAAVTMIEGADGKVGDRCTVAFGV